ncbi:MAG: histidinol dehydrogenase, partial [Anaerolineales bacterium]|nr:histidinol dehydrogenase [Anaerolineales bacterium]
MIKIYDIPTAQATILKRVPMTLAEYPPLLVAGVEALFGAGTTPPQAVSQILASVRQEGDAALRRWSKLLDKTELDDFKVPSEQLQAAYESLEPELSQALKLAAGRIRAFHELQPLPNWES